MKKNVLGFVFYRSLIDLVNWMGKMIEDGKPSFQEPPGFDLFWDLPCCLYILGKLRELDFYNSKTDRILKNLDPIVLSTYPQYPSNRLGLFFGMECLGIPEWKNHMSFLGKSFDADDLINCEFRDKNIHLEDGITGLVFLDNQLRSLQPNRKSLFEKAGLARKIVKSGYWDYVQGKENKELGLLHGITGVSWALMALS